MQVVQAAWSAKVTSLMGTDNVGEHQGLVLVSSSVETESCEAWVAYHDRASTITIVHLDDFDESDSRIAPVLVADRGRQFPMKALVMPCSDGSPMQEIGGHGALDPYFERPQAVKMPSVRFQIVQAFAPKPYARTKAPSGKSCSALIFCIHRVHDDAATCLVRVPIEAAEKWMGELLKLGPRGTFVSISPERGAERNPKDSFTPVIRPEGTSDDDYGALAENKLRELQDIVWPTAEVRLLIRQPRYDDPCSPNDDCLGFPWRISSRTLAYCPNNGGSPAPQLSGVLRMPTTGSWIGLH